MAKGYWVGHVEVTDANGYRAYIEANAAVFAQFGGRFAVRGGQQVVKEGTVRMRTVVIEFSDYPTALACYNSAEYSRVKALREPHSFADIVVVEGYDGPQPPER